jgi:hypothetical protein
MVILLSTIFLYPLLLFLKSIFLSPETKHTYWFGFYHIGDGGMAEVLIEEVF